MHAALAQRAVDPRAARGATRAAPAVVAPERVAPLAPAFPAATTLVTAVAAPAPVRAEADQPVPDGRPQQEPVASAPPAPVAGQGGQGDAPSPAVAVPHGTRPVTGDVAGEVLRQAALLEGIPYLLGGATRRGFDCSGFTQYVYAAAGVGLPRTAAQQFAATERVPAGSARPGDLVFFGDGPNKHHVAIVAGGGRVWHSPRPGKAVSLVPLWTSDVTYGRVTR